MAKSVCAQPGCPLLVDTGYCPTHTRARDRRRGSRQDRGYDAQHVRLRKSWEPKVATGQVVCRRAPWGTCLENEPRILPGAPWHLGHPDAECPLPLAPEHRRCNVSTASRR